MSLPNTIGSNFAFTCFGESHGRCVGVVIDGCPTGLELSEPECRSSRSQKTGSVDRHYAKSRGGSR